MKRSRSLWVMMLAIALVGGAFLALQGTPVDAQDDTGPGLIVYASDETGNYEIFTLDPETGELLQLTDDPAVDTHPMWSPDGERIVFSSDRDGDFEIYVMDADGSNVEQLTRNDADDVQPRWQPNGEHILYVSNVNGNWDLYVVSADGLSVRQLSNDPFDERHFGAAEDDAGEEGQVVEPTAPDVVATTPPPPAQPDATVSVSRLNLRGNPGEGANVLTVLNEDDPLEIIGRRFDNSWVQVRTATGTIGWVSTPLLNITVQLANIPVVDAPFFAPPTPMPTAIPATNTPDLPPVFISFTSDRGEAPTINSGECVTLSWNVQGIREVYFQGGPVTGQGSTQVCPTSTATYNLRVILTSGVEDNRYITVTVN
ncbi:MAG: SH3 domain-containing protein [Chloroflexi bacterium]|nr:SH3 domain-containing protein [Chloroflexota bacterium]